MTNEQGGSSYDSTSPSEYYCCFSTPLIASLAAFLKLLDARNHLVPAPLHPENSIIQTRAMVAVSVGYLRI